MGLTFRLTWVSSFLLSAQVGREKRPLNCLSGLEEIDSGSIALDGNLISSMNTIERDEVRRRLVSFVFQNLNLIPSLNAVDNVWIPARLSGKKATKKDALALLSGLGIADKAKDYPDSLSGGERQRIAIARSMATVLQ